MFPTKILLICADDSMSHAVITCLMSYGYKVIHTPLGMGALDLVRAEKPDVIILDIQLPDFNSLAIVRTLRGEETYNRVPIILMGSTMHEEDVLIGLEVGADLCLMETFHPQVFVARVRSLLRRTEAIKVR